ncbi:MAG TPA: Rrf2 family transcriptional regulator [Mariniflexile sp.]|nr:Rrf2 family transcriptional regulator [Mariniflexile sp.]HMR15193.1 Rrf2 family transcriptional regulator [Mariniflexile sp.]
MLSNSAKYAIKAVLFLAIHSNKEHKVMAKDIAEPINVPQAYIAKLLQTLVRKNLVSSNKGPKGGFYLEEENYNTSIMRIINAIDGEDSLNACMLSLEKCDLDKPCPLHVILSASRNHIVDNLNHKTVKDLVLSVEAGETFLPL